MHLGLSLSLTAQLRLSVSGYAASGLDPALVLDFGANYFRKSGSKSTLSDTVTHSRASNATMVDADGVLKWAPHNLLRYSEDFSNAAWSKFAGLSATVSSMTFSADPYSRIVTSVSNPTAGDVTIKAFFVPSDAGKIVTLGLWDSARNGSSSGRSTNLTIPASGIVEYSWTSVSGVTNIGVMSELSGLAQTVTFASGLAYYRSDLGGMVNNPETGNSYVPTTTAAVYMPRVGHHIYDGYEWFNEGILHESEARTNLTTTSVPVAADYGSILSVSITGGQLNPFTGANDGVLMTAAAGGGEHQASLPSFFSAPLSVVDVCTSFVVKKGTASHALVELDGAAPAYTGKYLFDLTSGATTQITAASGLVVATQLAPDVWRLSITDEVDGSAGNPTVYLGPSDGTGISWTAAGTETLTILSAQVEAGSTPSSYIPTAGATVTRAAETLTVPAANMPDYMTPTVIGGEEVTNGTFTGTGNVVNWTLDGDAVNNNGVDVFDVTAGAATNVVATQVIALTIGNTYQLSFERVTGTGSCSVSAASAGLPTLYSVTVGVETRTFVATATSATLLINSGSGGLVTILDNISVKEINPLAVSIQMDGKMNYADTDDFNEVTFMRWRNASTTERLMAYIATDGTRTGKFVVTSETADTPVYATLSSPEYTAGLNVPFNFALATTSTTVRSGSNLGTSPTVSQAGVPELSAEDFEVGQDFSGTISKLRVWGEDISDTGIATATAPTFTDEFAMTVTTTTANETFTIPCQNSGTFNAGIQWGDGSVSTVTAYNDANLTHTFATAGDHLIRIRGSFPNIYFNNVGDKLKVKSVDNLGIVGWTRLDNAFRGCSNMTSFTAGTTDTSAVTVMNTMFSDCSSLTALDLSSFNTAAVTNINSMFYRCSNLTTLDLSSFNTAAVTNMTYMFQSCSSLTALDVSSFNTAAVTNIKRMFYGCSSLTALDVSNFNTASVTNMYEMFRDCPSITSLDLSNFNTTAVVNMTAMFANCFSLTALDVSGFNTAAVTDINSMFYRCTSLTSLDLSSFNTTAVTNMAFMFQSCSNLTDIIGVEDFNIEGLNSTGDLNNFMTTVTLPTARYDALLINWDAQEAFDAMTPHFGNSTYTGGGTAAAARANLISNDGWTITDGGIA